jgi:hypothetical protein
VLSLAELEELRDDLTTRVADGRRALSERTYVEEQNRRLIEEMQLEPGRYRWVRVANEDIGEPGCKHWHVRPRWGVFGMLMNWWRVVISSGCPLAGRLRPLSHLAKEIVFRRPAQSRGSGPVVCVYEPLEAADQHRGLARVLCPGEVGRRGDGVGHRDGRDAQLAAAGVAAPDPVVERLQPSRADRHVHLA